MRQVHRTFKVLARRVVVKSPTEVDPCMREVLKRTHSGIKQIETLMTVQRIPAATRRVSTRFTAFSDRELWDVDVVLGESCDVLRV